MASRHYDEYFKRCFADCAPASHGIAAVNPCCLGLACKMRLALDAPSYVAQIVFCVCVCPCLIIPQRHLVTFVAVKVCDISEYRKTLSNPFLMGLI